MTDYMMLFLANLFVGFNHLGRAVLMMLPAIVILGVAAGIAMLFGWTP